LREVSVSVRTGRPEKHQYSRRFGSHLGDPGFGVVRFSTFATVSARNGPEGPHLRQWRTERNVTNVTRFPSLKWCR